MTVFTDYLWFHTAKQQEFIRITDDVASIVKKSGVQEGEDNADAHLKRTIMGHQVILPITGGELDLGPWEQVFYAEFDGRRKKRVVVKVMGV